LKLSSRMALLLAAVFALGADVVGPSVFVIEFEPVPRQFALCLVLLGVGLCAHGRYVGGAVAGAAGALFHPPAVIPFGVVFSLQALTAKIPFSRRLVRLLPFIVAAIVLAIAMRVSHEDTNGLFDKLGTIQKQIQNARDSYVFVSRWFPAWAVTYFLLWGISIAAVVRMWPDTAGSRFYLLGMPAFGMFSIPLSYLITERLNLNLGPQMQPARALLYVTLFAIIGGTAAGLKAAGARRFVEAFVWFFIAIGTAIQIKFLDLIRFPHVLQNRLAVTVGICVLLLLAAIPTGKPGYSMAAWLAAICAPAFLIASFAHLERLYRPDTTKVRAVAAWAAANTPRDAVFLFPETGSGPDSGFFRSEAQRAIYVDWNSGGQVNFVKDFGPLWLDRWNSTREAALPAKADERAARLGTMGIDYAVVRTEKAWPELKPVFRDSQFTVYRLRQ
jgi:hypothetical protein